MISALDAHVSSKAAIASQPFCRRVVRDLAELNADIKAAVAAGRFSVAFHVPATRGGGSAHDPKAIARALAKCAIKAGHRARVAGATVEVEWGDHVAAAARAYERTKLASALTRKK